MDPADSDDPTSTKCPINCMRYLEEHCPPYTKALANLTLKFTEEAVHFSGILSAREANLRQNNNVPLDADTLSIATDVDMLLLGQLTDDVMAVSAPPSQTENESTVDDNTNLVRVRKAKFVRESLKGAQMYDCYEMELAREAAKQRTILNNVTTHQQSLNMESKREADILPLPRLKAPLHFHPPVPPTAGKERARIEVVVVAPLCPPSSALLGHEGIASDIAVPRHQRTLQTITEPPQVEDILSRPESSAILIDKQIVADVNDASNVMTSPAFKNITSSSGNNTDTTGMEEPSSISFSQCSGKSPNRTFQSILGDSSTNGVVRTTPQKHVPSLRKLLNEGADLIQTITRKRHRPEDNKLRFGPLDKPVIVKPRWATMFDEFLRRFFQQATGNPSLMAFISKMSLEVVSSLAKFATAKSESSRATPGIHFSRQLFNDNVQATYPVAKITASANVLLVGNDFSTSEWNQNSLSAQLYRLLRCVDERSGTLPESCLSLHQRIHEEDDGTTFCTSVVGHCVKYHNVKDLRFQSLSTSWGDMPPAITVVFVVESSSRSREEAALECLEDLLERALNPESVWNISGIVLAIEGGRHKVQSIKLHLLQFIEKHNLKWDHTTTIKGSLTLSQRQCDHKNPYRLVSLPTIAFIGFLDVECDDHGKVLEDAFRIILSDYGKRIGSFFPILC